MDLDSILANIRKTKKRFESPPPPPRRVSRVQKPQIIRDDRRKQHVPQLCDYVLHPGPDSSSDEIIWDRNGKISAKWLLPKRIAPAMVEKILDFVRTQKLNRQPKKFEMPGASL